MAWPVCAIQDSTRSQSTLQRSIQLLMIVYIYEAAADTFVDLPDMPADMPLQICTAIQALQAIETGELTLHALPCPALPCPFIALSWPALPCPALPSHCPAMLYTSMALSWPALLTPWCALLLLCPALFCYCTALPSSLSCLPFSLPMYLCLLCFVPLVHAASHILVPYLKSGLQSPALPLSCPALHCPCLLSHIFELSL